MIGDLHRNLVNEGLAPEAERLHWLGCSARYRERLERAAEDFLDDDTKEELEHEIECKDERIAGLKDLLSEAEDDRDDALKECVDLRLAIKDARELAKKALAKLEEVNL